MFKRWHASGSAKLTDFGLAKQYRGGRDAIAEAAFPT